MNSTTTRALNRGRRFRWLPFAVLVAGGFWSACSILPQATIDPTRYYLLTGNSAAEASAPVPHGTLHVGVRPVELPGYLLNNRTIVVRRGTNEILYQDYARWAEPLDTTVQRVVRDRLLENEAVSSAQFSPFSIDGKRDYDISVRIERCEGGRDANGVNTAQFSANYEISDARKGGEIVVRKHFTAAPMRWDGTNFSALAEALSGEAAALGNDIAASLPR